MKISNATTPAPAATPATPASSPPPASPQPSISARSSAGLPSAFSENIYDRPPDEQSRRLAYPSRAGEAALAGATGAEGGTSGGSGIFEGLSGQQVIDLLNEGQPYNKKYGAMYVSHADEKSLEASQNAALDLVQKNNPEKPLYVNYDGQWYLASASDPGSVDLMDASGNTRNVSSQELRDNVQAVLYRTDLTLTLPPWMNDPNGSIPKEATNRKPGTLAGNDRRLG
jgi:hypothetical protein